MSRVTGGQESAERVMGLDTETKIVTQAAGLRPGKVREGQKLRELVRGLTLGQTVEVVILRGTVRCPKRVLRRDKTLPLPAFSITATTMPATRTLEALTGVSSLCPERGDEMVRK